MHLNPFLELYHHPVSTLTAAAYALVLVTAVLVTWVALGRNLLALQAAYQTNWKYLPPWSWVIRAAAVPLVCAVDLLLIAGAIAVLTHP